MATSTSTTSTWTIAGKVCIVTGANVGIGFETAKELARQGAGKVILACRNVEAAEEAAIKIRQEVAGSKTVVLVRQLDLSSLDSVRQFAKAINETEPELQVLVNNAGVHAANDRRHLSKDGFELTFATNHLGHFLLTNLLLPLLKRSSPSRIVVVSSAGYFLTWPWGLDVDDLNAEQPGKYGAFRAYCQSKLANILFVRSLNQRLNRDDSNSVSCFSLHPGFIHTTMARRHQSRLFLFFFAPLQRLFALPEERGADTSIYCCCEPGIEKDSGGYFANMRATGLWSLAKDDAKAEKLWQLSEKMSGLQPLHSTTN